MVFVSCAKPKLLLKNKNARIFTVKTLRPSLKMSRIDGPVLRKANHPTSLDPRVAAPGVSELSQAE